MKTTHPLLLFQLRNDASLDGGITIFAREVALDIDILMD